MVAAVVVLLGFGADFAQSHFPIDLDRLPPGAKARLGSARYHGNDVKLSPDGKLIAVLTDCRPHLFTPIINIHDATTGRLLRTLRPNALMQASTRIQWIDFVSDTRLLAGDSINDYQLYAFDATTGSCETILDRMKQSGNWSHLSAVSDDARLIVECNPVKVVEELLGEYIVWQTKPLKKLHVIHPVHRTRGAPWHAWSLLSRDGRTLITGGYNATPGSTDDRFVQVWDTATGKERTRIQVADGRLRSWFALNADGSRLAVRQACVLRVFDTSSGKVVLTIPEDSSDDDTIEFDHDGTRLLLFRETSLKVFSATIGKKLKDYAVPAPADNEQRGADQVAFTREGKGRILSFRWFEIPAVYDLETGEPLTPCAGHGRGIQTLRFSADSKRLISLDEPWPILGGSELTWDIASRKTFETSPRGVEIEGRLGFEWRGFWRSSDRKLLFGLEADRSAGVVAFDATTAKRLYRIELPEWLAFLEFPSLITSPDGKHFFLVGKVEGLNGDFPIYESATGRVSYTVKIDNVNGLTGSFSPDGSRIALHVVSTRGATTEAKQIVVDTKTGKVVRRQACSNDLRLIGLLADNRIALMRHLEADELVTRLCTWDPLTGKVLGSWKEPGTWHTLYVGETPGVLSEDGSLFACATGDLNGIGLHIRLIDTATLTERAAFSWKPGWSVNRGVPEPPTALAISPDNKTLAVGLNNGTIVLYDIPPAKKPTPK